MYEHINDRVNFMSYDEFKEEYTKLFNRMNEYSVDQAGSSYFAEKLADLSDEHPEFEERFEDELCGNHL